VVAVKPFADLLKELPGDDAAADLAPPVRSAAAVEVLAEPLESKLGKRNRASPKEKRQERLREIEDELLGESLAVLNSSLKFADFDLKEQKEPPAEWVEEHGREEATKMFRIAQLANMSQKEAPIAFIIAKNLAVGIVKARATERAAPRSLALVYLNSAPPPSFPVRSMEERSDG
jgi:hypothetical protein